MELSHFSFFYVCAFLKSFKLTWLDLTYWSQNVVHEKDIIVLTATHVCHLAVTDRWLTTIYQQYIMFFQWQLKFRKLQNDKLSQNHLLLTHAVNKKICSLSFRQFESVGVSLVDFFYYLYLYYFVLVQLSFLISSPNLDSQVIFLSQRLRSQSEFTLSALQINRLCVRKASTLTSSLLPNHLYSLVSLLHLLKPSPCFTSEWYEQRQTRTKD